MANNKKQHFVPRFLLKNFSADGKSLGLVNLPTRRIVPSANLKNQCYKDYLYGQDGVLEENLAKIESEAAQLIRRICQEGAVPRPLSVEHYLLSQFILIQISRTTYYIDAANELHDKMFKHLFKQKFKEDTGEDLDAYNVGLEGTSHFVLGMNLQMYPMIMDLGIKLLTAETDADFIISDNPVVSINPFMSQILNFGSNTGYASKGLIVLLPLTPKQSLILYDRKIYRVGRTRQNVCITARRDVETLNTLQVCNCEKNAYFLTDNFGIDALINRYEKHRRKRKANVKTIFRSPTKDGHREYVANFLEDISYRPKLSFLGVRKSARTWRAKAKKAKSHPGIYLRNHKLNGAFEEFCKKVENGEYGVAEFFGFLLIEKGFDSEIGRITVDQAKQRGKLDVLV